MSDHNPSNRLRTDDHADNWHGVQDARKRKQIQDRLAQRARRKRLQETKSKSRIEPPRSDASSSTIYLAREPGDFPGYAENLTSSPIPTPSTDSCDVSSTELAISSCVTPSRISDEHSLLGQTQTTSLALQPAMPMSVFTALYVNGAMMGLSCSTTVPSKSSPVSLDIPPSLYPTSLQLTTIHARWIDRFPFPHMRDNMIAMSAIIDDEDFLRDLFTSPSFTLKAGRPSWDPGAWVIEKVFAEKWGYLFF